MSALEKIVFAVVAVLLGSIALLISTSPPAWVIWLLGSLGVIGVIGGLGIALAVSVGQADSSRQGR